MKIRNIIEKKLTKIIIFIHLGVRCNAYIISNPCLVKLKACFIFTKSGFSRTKGCLRKMKQALMKIICTFAA
ncbi:MAG: hypothetical protein LBL74_03935 [Bacteroidales bacterium]|nr:hypothetical protein [Bacteroidales bacterium]